jgi:hypothetical protein
MRQSAGEEGLHTSVAELVSGSSNKSLIKLSVRKCGTGPIGSPKVRIRVVRTQRLLFVSHSLWVCLEGCAIMAVP